MSFDRDTVLSSLTLDAVLAAYGIEGRWSGRWLRARRCPIQVHGTDAFGVSREGKWHCHACDLGGDILALIAAAEGLDVASAFGDVLAIAAGIAGVEPEADFGEMPPAPRAPTKKTPVPPEVPLADRLLAARARCEWVWAHLKSPDQVERVQQTGRHWYLETRGIPWREIPDRVRINVRDLGFWTVPGAYEELWKIVASQHEKDPRRAADAIKKIYNGTQGVAVAVRHIETGNIVDVRARRAEVADGEPKIMGMPASVTVDRGELVACYGNPHALEADVIVVAEGWADYLTAGWRWPHADVLGAVDAGQYPLVAGFAARYLAERGRGRLVLVAQDDGDERVNERGQKVVPAAKRAVEAAIKRSVGMLGPGGVGTWESRAYGVKDLNDMARAGRADELPEEP